VVVAVVVLGSWRQDRVQSMRFRWHPWAAFALGLIYVLPHFWWMFGVSAGFPGDSEDFALAFSRTWFAAYNVLTTALVVCGVAAVVALDNRARNPIVATIVKIGAVLLLLRGLLGVLSIVPGLAVTLGFDVPDVLNQELAFWPVIWEAWFLVTGLVFLDSARNSRGLGPGGSESRT
jgi:hypothetical protein